MRTPRQPSARDLHRCAIGGGAMQLGFQVREAHRIVDLAACPARTGDRRPAGTRCAGCWADIAGGRPGERLGDAAGRRPRCAVAGLVAARGRRPWAAGGICLEADLARLCWQQAAGAPVEPLAVRRQPRALFGGVPVAVLPVGFCRLAPQVKRRCCRSARRDRRGSRRCTLRSGTFALPLALATLGSMPSMAMRTPSRRWQPPGVRYWRWPRGCAASSGTCSCGCSPQRSWRGTPQSCSIRRAPARGRRRRRWPLRWCRRSSTFVQPRNLARDARLLADGGYRLEEVTPVDQFLWSPHVELAAVFRREK
ncbi:MAG: hypothetical protein U1E35_01600 [Rhodospirillales bacterium]